MTEVYVIKVHDDGITWDEMSTIDATGMVDGFRRGGSQLEPINGGVRIWHNREKNSYWDVVLREAADDLIGWKKK